MAHAASTDGPFCPAGRFNTWVRSLPHKTKVFTPGNMDMWYVQGGPPHRVTWCYTEASTSLPKTRLKLWLANRQAFYVNTPRMWFCAAVYLCTMCTAVCYRTEHVSKDELAQHLDSMVVLRDEVLEVGAGLGVGMQATSTSGRST